MDPIFTDDIYFALPEILQLIWADKPKQMPQSASIHSGILRN